MFAVQCHVSIAPVYIAPDHKSELFTQLLRGDNVRIIDIKGKWALVENLWNGDRGWVLKGQLKQVKMPLVFKGLVHWGNENNHVAGTMLQDQASKLQVFTEAWYARYRQFCKQQALALLNMEVISGIPEMLLAQQLVEFQQYFLNVPYCWGGLSSRGIDCSGLVQLFYRFRGIPLPHNASKQAELGKMVDFMMEVLPGDLAFFDDEDGQITHVGLMISTQQVFHASAGNGMVSVDAIDMEGIMNAKGERTHHLRFIRRLEKGLNTTGNL